MAKRKYHYYVLVLTENGAVFVTKLGIHHTAYWSREEKPYEMNDAWSQDVANGLTLNGYMAFPIKVMYEIDHQPYRYDLGHFEWIANKEN